MLLQVCVLSLCLQVFNNCVAEVDAIIIAGIPNIEDCTVSLKEDFGVTANYNADSGKFVVLGSLLQLQHVTDRLTGIFTVQQRMQQPQLMRLGQTGVPPLDHMAGTLNTRSRDLERWSDERGADRQTYVREGDAHWLRHETMGTYNRSLRDPVVTHGYDRWSPSGLRGQPGYDTELRAQSGYETGARGQNLPDRPCYSDVDTQQSVRLGINPAAAKLPAAVDQHWGTAGQRELTAAGPVCPTARAYTGNIGHISPTAVYGSPTHGHIYPTADYNSSGHGQMRPAGATDPMSPVPGGSPGSADPATPSATSDLDYYVVEYLLRSERTRLRSMEQQYGVTIKPINRVCDEIVTAAFQRYNPVIEPENEEEAQKTFLALYESIYHNIIQCSVHVSAREKLDTGDMVEIIYQTFQDRVFAVATGEHDITLVGPYAEVSQVEIFLQKSSSNKPGDLEQHWPGYDGQEEREGPGMGQEAGPGVEPGMRSHTAVVTR